DPTSPACVTAVDTFPPAAPSGLSTLPSEGQIQLEWNPVTAPDLAGYLVLRAEEAAPPQPLMTDPIAEPRYKDTTVKAGPHYAHVVAGVDKAGNRSAPPNGAEEPGRCRDACFVCLAFPMRTRRVMRPSAKGAGGW